MVRASLITVAVLASSLISVATTQAQGQAPGQAQPGLVVVLDMVRIFKAHPGHQAAMAKIEARAEEMRKSFQAQQVDLQEKAKKAASQYQGAQLDQIEITLRQDEVKLQTQARQAQTELMKSEAEAFYKTHSEVMTIVQELCQQYNVGLVLGYDSEPIDPSRPESVIRGVQRSVVYHSNDLTDHVLHRIPGAVKTAGTAGPVSGSRDGVTR
ncbi:MAG: OmpH family outer membrane protein [Pirellulaceae bacterium]|nr:OmpH family outer membrane protein [Pirellulaceae bacterium]